MNSSLYCPLAYLPDGWREAVVIEFDTAGSITAVHANRAQEALARAAGPVIPGMPNLHSHAFQRAMAGLSERAGAEQDSFWTWRESMYRFVEVLTPQALQAIAAQLYVVMLKHGYTAVGEFHYLHHAPDGQPYAQRAELSQRVIDAALQTGIGQTHLPVLYAYGGFGAAPPSRTQRRFVNDLDGFFDIFDSLQTRYRRHGQLRIGLALHSLRAVSPALLAQAVARTEHDTPIHIHIAEQQGEVEDCLAWSGQRPVEWLLANAAVDARWCLVHATHMTPAETRAAAASGAVAGLCPTTEANLGDGLFPAIDYLAAAGRFGIGSDSQVTVCPAQELRLLEYAQRLRTRQRNVLRVNGASTGAGLYSAALRGGAQALGQRIGAIEPGYRADWLVLDGEHPLLWGKSGDQILDTYVFCGSADMIRDVYVGGRQLVKQGRHFAEESINQDYRTALRELHDQR